MKKISPEAFRLLTRRRFDVFVQRVFAELHDGAALQLSWLILTMAWHLNEMFHGRLRRLIINVPPRHLKSIISSVAFPAFLLGNDPSHEVLIICYTQELADKMMRNIRKVMTSDWFRACFPEIELVRESQIELITSRGGNIRVSSVEGGIMGMGADTIIIDDPINANDVYSETIRNRINAWFRRSMYTRLNNRRRGNIVLTMQRLHEDDPTGHLTAEAGHGWTMLRIPAIATESTTYPLMERHGVTEHVREVGDLIDPERQNQADLDQLRRDLGDQIFSAQYQQDPLAREGNIFKREHFQLYEPGEISTPYDAIVASWDTASSANETNDYSVCTIWGIRGTDYYLIRLYRERLEYPQLRQKALEIFERHKPNLVLVEHADSGRGLGQDLRQVLRRISATAMVVAVPVRFAKEDRAAFCAVIVEQHRVYLPRGAEWIDGFVDEVTGFPRTRFDDQVDSFTQFLNYMRQQPQQTLVYGQNGRKSINHLRKRRR